MTSAAESLERAMHAYWEAEGLRSAHFYARFLDMAARKGWLSWEQLNGRAGPTSLTQAYLLDWNSEFDRRRESDEDAER